MKINIDLDQFGVTTDGIDITITDGRVYYGGYVTIDSDTFELPEQPWVMADVPYSQLMDEVVRRGDGLENLIKHYFLADTRANR